MSRKLPSLRVQDRSQFLANPRHLVLRIHKVARERGRSRIYLPVRRFSVHPIRNRLRRICCLPTHVSQRSCRRDQRFPAAPMRVLRALWHPCRAMTRWLSIHRWHLLALCKATDRIRLRPCQTPIFRTPLPRPSRHPQHLRCQGRPKSHRVPTYSRVVLQRARYTLSHLSPITRSLTRLTTPAQIMPTLQRVHPRRKRNDRVGVSPARQNEPRTSH